MLTEEQKRILESGQPVSDAPLWQERQDVESGKVTETSAYARIPTGVLEKETRKVYPIIISDKGKELVQNADKTLAGLTAQGISEPSPDDLAKQEEIKKEEPTTTFEEAGTTPTGEKMYLDTTTGLIETASQIQRRNQEKIDTEKKVNQQMSAAEQELASLKSQLASYKISDTDVQNQINTITQRWDAQIALMRDVNTRRQEHIKTLGTRLGSRWAGGMGGVFGGIIAEEERQGIMRIGELESKKQEAINSAKEAQRKQNWDVYVQQVEIAQKTVEEQRKAVQEANKLALDKQKAITDRMKEMREQEKADLDNSEKLVKSLGYTVLSALTGDEEKDSEIIKSIASQYGVDPNKLLSEAQRLQQEKVKYPTGDIGEYMFYRDQALENGVSQNQIMDFPAYQKYSANLKAQATAAGGMTPKETQNFMTITNNYQKDELVKQADKAVSLIAIADQIIANPEKAVNQLKALYILVKNLDPDSAVREGEIALAERTQSYLGVWKTKLDRISEGKLMQGSTAIELANATKELATAWQFGAKQRTQRYQAQSETVGIGDAFRNYIQQSAPIKGEGTAVTAPDGTKVIITD